MVTAGLGRGRTTGRVGLGVGVTVGVATALGAGSTVGCGDPPHAAATTLRASRPSVSGRPRPVCTQPPYEGGDPTTVSVEHTDRRGQRTATALVTSWTALALGNSFYDGEWSQPGLILALAGFALAVSVVALRLPIAPPSRRVLAIPVLAALIAAVVHPAHRHMHTPDAAQSAIDVLVVVTAALALGSLVLPRALQGVAWLALALIAVATGLVVIATVSDPRIDVWHFLQQSSEGLLHGANMYEQRWHDSPGWQDIYPYLPLTTVLLAPFQWVFGDVRVGLVLA